MPETEAAFREFRLVYGPKALRAGLVENPDQVVQMTAKDGLLMWADGPLQPHTATAATGEPPSITDAMLDGRKLWVVTEKGVPHAPEKCPFGVRLTSKVIKHSNLTGGGPA